MDIAFTKPLDFQTLAEFLQAELPGRDIFLLDKDDASWEDVPPGKAIFQYHVNEGLPGPFKFGLSVFTDHDEPLLFIEHLARTLSDQFQCAALCDASRVGLKENKTYYSLLFENGLVYLVDDFDFEAQGEVTKIVCLNYDLNNSEVTGASKRQ